MRTQVIISWAAMSPMNSGHLVYKALTCWRSFSAPGASLLKRWQFDVNTAMK